MTADGHWAGGDWQWVGFDDDDLKLISQTSPPSHFSQLRSLAMSSASHSLHFDKRHLQVWHSTLKSPINTQGLLDANWNVPRCGRASGAALP